MDFIGFPYPITETPQGYFRPVTGVELLKADLLVLLLTNPGERVMTPEFGIDLRSLLFEPADDTTASAAREMIIEGIRRWEPRLSIESIDTQMSPDEGILLIRIRFHNPDNIAQIESLEIELPAGGA